MRLWMLELVEEGLEAKAPHGRGSPRKIRTVYQFLYLSRLLLLLSLNDGQMLDYSDSQAHAQRVGQAERVHDRSSAFVLV